MNLMQIILIIPLAALSVLVSLVFSLPDKAEEDALHRLNQFGQ